MATAASSSLPLHCSVCPKKPDFSDVSHLLTHIASKGHLSHYYKLKVRSSQDQDARNIIDAYDDWYNVWNIEDLMSARLQDKEKKRPRARAQASTQRPPAKKIKKPAGTRSVDSGTSALYSPIPEMPAPFHAFQDQTISSINRPKLFLWSTQRPTSFVAIPVEPSSPISPIFGDNVASSQNDTIVDDDEEDTTIVDEAARLKGVFWPGMDIFDSATADMKRRRNQKKDVSVLEHLEQSSLVVEATEVIYYSLGDLKKARKITGKVESSSSPMSEPLILPVKRKPQTKKPLAERSVNTSNSRPLIDDPKKALRSAPTSNRSRSTNQSRKFSVYEDVKPYAEDAAAMPLLTAEFQPADSNPGFDLYRPSTQIGLASQYASTGFGQHVQATFAPHQSSLAFGQHDFYGPTGYDLAAFLSHSLHREPPNLQTQRRTSHRPSPDVRSDQAHDHVCADHGARDALGANLPLNDTDMQHEALLDFADDDLEVGESVLLISDDME